nr:MAG TPA: hypothetical protein [Bacteriophage sp.]
MPANKKSPGVTSTEGPARTCYQHAQCHQPPNHQELITFLLYQLCSKNERS